MLKNSNLWLIILCLVILTYCLTIFNGLAARAKNAENALASYKQAQTELVLKQHIEHTKKLTQAQLAINAEKDASLKLLQDLQINRIQTAQKLKAQYDTNIATLKRNLANRTSGVLPATDSNHSTTAATPSNPSEPTEAWRDCNATLTGLQSQYATLEDACTITTVDYNQLRGWADAVCSMATCE